MNSPSTWLQIRASLRQTWLQRSPREQQLLSICTLGLLLVATWSTALAPALRTWQEAPARQAQLDAQSKNMLQLQAQQKGLQKPNPITRSESIQWLETSLAELGPGAKISQQGERATLSLNAAPAEALARWLSLARESALSLPVQAQLQQSTAPTRVPVKGQSALTSPPQNEVHWRGTLLLRLP